MSGSSQVIRATQMFTKDGYSKKVSLVREIVTGFSLGIGFGLIWKVSGIFIASSCWTLDRPTSSAYRAPSYHHVSIHPMLVQTYHWNEKRKTEEYYEELASLPNKE